MKKVIVLLLALMLVFGIVGCSSAPAEQAAAEPAETAEVPVETPEPTPEATVEATPEPTPEKVTETGYMDIDGIYVDNSYTDDENPNLKLLYLFYTVSTDDQNLQISSSTMSLTVGDTNTYLSDHYSGSCKYMSSYYYNSYVEDLYLGDSLKVVSTFEIPEGDLTAEKAITLENPYIPETENILMSTDDIIFCSSVEEIAEAADPVGLADETKKREDADEDTVSKVQEAINDHYWEFYVTPASYRLEFYSPNEFEVTTGLGSNSGTYSVKNGYIFCEYSSNGYTVEIPYQLGDDGVELDVTYAFSVYEN